MPSKKLEAAIDRLADCFECGHLQAEAAPTEFIGQAADEIVSLRAELARVKAELDAERSHIAHFQEFVMVESELGEAIARAEKAEARLAAVLAECQKCEDEWPPPERRTTDAWEACADIERIRAAATVGDRECDA